MSVFCVMKRITDKKKKKKQDTGIHETILHSDYVSNLACLHLSSSQSNERLNPLRKMHQKMI